MQKTTIHLDEELHRILKLRAATAGTSISAQVNDSLRRTLEEDAADAEESLRRFRKERTQAIRLDDARTILAERGLL
ncbi:MAG: hypothetical protein R3190_09210 [Thermoanaerobaculia bacterium]|nr:hypothetical protein [Thermoanaerobaculia bacterium]